MYQYRIKKIEPKSGVLKDVHKRALGKKCRVLELTKGHSAILQYELDEDMDAFRNFYTSRVLNVTQDCDMVIIETVNTLYLLEELRD